MINPLGNPLRLLNVHRTSAWVVGIFAVIHIAHHLLSLNSIDLHLSVGRLLRSVYRSAWIEPMLLLAVAVQWTTGLALTYRRWHLPAGQKLWLPKAQGWSGLVLSFFLPVHVLSVLQGRASGLDTNFYFAAAGLHMPGLSPWFALYYGLAVMAVILHLYIALMRRTRAAPFWPVAAFAGAVCGTLLVLALAGHIHHFDLPANYRANVSSASR